MKKFVGKWYKKFEGEILNVINDNEKSKIKMSFESSGHFNFEPNCFYMEENKLCYEINDEVYRRVYKVEIKNNKLIGSYTQQGNTVNIEYEKLSNIPDDIEYYFKPSHICVPNTDKSRIEVLKEYSCYSDKKDDNVSNNKFTLLEQIPEALYQYNYNNYVDSFNNTPCDDMVFSLLDFVSDNFKHDGSSGMPSGRKVEDFLEFLQNHDNKTNCRGLAILLSNLLRMNGIKATHITCKPYEDPFDDCHVVVDCWLPSGARIMIDPTFRLYLKNGKGNYISLYELRKMLINDENYYHNDNASYNSEGFDINYYREYMTKNTFRFSKCFNHYNGCEEGKDGRAELIPLNYSITEFCEQVKTEFTYDQEQFWN